MVYQEQVMQIAQIVAGYTSAAQTCSGERCEEKRRSHGQRTNSRGRCRQEWHQ
ncbi:MAG: hypothetical protein ACLSHC_11875 [Bilophila wadsworthia]